MNYIFLPLGSVISLIVNNRFVFLLTELSDINVLWTEIKKMRWYMRKVPIILSKENFRILGHTTLKQYCEWNLGFTMAALSLIFSSKWTQISASVGKIGRQIQTAFFQPHVLLKYTMHKLCSCDNKAFECCCQDYFFLKLIAICDDIVLFVFAPICILSILQRIYFQTSYK